MHRHHLIPHQVLNHRCFGSFLDEIGREQVGFHDFRMNGMLLPATDAATMRTGMPLHRGPHRTYNEMVMERVGRIESHWALSRLSDAHAAGVEALERLSLLKSALRRRLLNERQRMVLNRKDPLGTGFDFAELDAMADTLWEAS